MKIAYFGNDLLSGILKALLLSEHNVVCCFVNKLPSCAVQIRQYCDEADIPVHDTAPTIAHLSKLVRNGVDVFVSAEFQSKIPLPSDLPYGINFHPTMLPYGKGKTPLPYLVTEYFEHAGLTCHKLTGEMDSGEIIAQKAIVLDDRETTSSLVAKINIEAAGLVNTLFSNFSELYQKATPQLIRPAWPEYSLENKWFNFQKTAAETAKQIAAFGHFGMALLIDQKETNVVGASVSKYNHIYEPGHIVFEDFYSLVIAIKDGLLFLPKQGMTNR